MKYARIIVSGRVQGVGYRYYVYQYAIAHNLKGSVRNLGDGRVEVICAADEKEVEQLIPALEKGPAFSRVEKIIVRWEDAVHLPFKRFIIE